MAQRAIDKIGNYRLGTSRGQYVVRWEDQGRDRKIQLGLATQHSKTIAKQVFAAWVMQRDAAQAAVQDYSIGEIFEKYVTDRDAEGKRADKMRHQWQALKGTFAHLYPPQVQLEVEVEGRLRTVCHKYAVQRQKLGRKKATIYDELMTLRTALNWAFKRGLIDCKPYVWTPSKPKPRSTELTREQAVRFISCAYAYHIKLLLIIALFTGARKGAIQELTWDRVDLELGTIDFQLDDADDDILNSGTSKSRSHVAVPPVLQTILSDAKAVAQTDYVIEFNGRSVQNAKKGIAAAAKRAGLSGRYIGAHAFRHTAATMAADRGVSMREIQKMMGHDRIETTERIYAKHSPEYTLPATAAIADTVGSMEGIFDMGQTE